MGEQSLNMHIEPFHDNSKPYKCESCDKCLSRKGHLKRHYLHDGSLKHQTIQV